MGAKVIGDLAETVTVQALVSTAVTAPVTVGGAGGVAAGLAVVIVSAIAAVLPNAASTARAIANLRIKVSIWNCCSGRFGRNRQRRWRDHGGQLLRLPLANFTSS